MMNMKILRAFTIAVLSGILFMIPPPAFSDIYTFVDQDGVTHFTNTPTSRKYRLFLREKPSNHASLYIGKGKGSARLNLYDPHIRKAAETHGVDFPLLKAIIKVESDFDSRAVSDKGAVGLMQIMPDNFSHLNLKNPYDPGENIMAGTRYFRRLLDRFGELRLALAAYNSGPDRVERFQSVLSIPETEEYIRKVMKYYTFFKY